MSETLAEETQKTQNQDSPTDPTSRFMSDFGTLEKKLNSFLELPPDATKSAVLANLDCLEEMRNAMVDFRIQIRAMHSLFKPYALSQKPPKLLRPDRDTDLSGTKILGEIIRALFSCRDSFCQTIQKGNPAGSTYNLCKPPTMAHRLERTDRMIDDLLFFFEKIGPMEPLESPLPEIRPLEQATPTENEQAETEFDDEEMVTDAEAPIENTKTLAEELADHFLLLVKMSGLPNPYKIAKGYGQYYPGLVGENLHILKKDYLDPEMVKACDRLYGTSPNDELVMVRRGNRFRLAIVNKTALIDPSRVVSRSLRPNP